MEGSLLIAQRLFSPFKSLHQNLTSHKSRKKKNHMQPPRPRYRSPHSAIPRVRFLCDLAPRCLCRCRGCRRRHTRHGRRLCPHEVRNMHPGGARRIFEPVAGNGARHGGRGARGAGGCRGVSQLADCYFFSFFFFFFFFFPFLVLTFITKNPISAPNMKGARFAVQGMGVRVRLCNT
jgi:hypothetical protein